MQQACNARLAVRPQPQPQIVEHFVPQQQQPVVQSALSPAAQPVDYQKMINELRAELKARDAAQAKEMQRIHGKVDLLDNYQLAVERDTLDNSRSIQLLAARTDTRE